MSHDLARRLLLPDNDWETTYILNFISVLTRSVFVHASCSRKETS